MTFEDLDKVDLDHYKAIVFVNTFVMNSAQRRLISTTVAKNDRHLIWVYAPAYCDETKLNTGFIQEVTGMKLTKVTSNDPVSITLDSAIVKTGPINLGKNTITTPLFVVNHGDAIPLGWLNNTSVGLASKKLAHSTSWFMTLPLDKPDLWRYIFRKAGAHLYTESQAIIYSGQGTITVHTKDGGPVVLRSRNGKLVNLAMPPNSTWLIDDETGELLFK